MESRFVASMLLAGVGDAMGFKRGDWEFCFDGEKIHADVKRLGGVELLKITKPDFIVSDDTVLLLSTADALIEKSNTENLEELYAEIAFHYKRDFSLDMKDRAGGLTTANSCHLLKPNLPNGWHIPFNLRGGGCGAAMRAMCIGLRYPNVFNAKCLERLIKVSVESGRMTHNHPTGFLGSFATALFGGFSVCGVPLNKWGYFMLMLLPKVFKYIEAVGRDVEDNKKEWSYFQERWMAYLTERNILFGKTDPVFPENYGIKERDAFYKSCAYRGWGGSSGHDAPMIAYDALLFAKDNWVDLCHHGMLHSGDNDSTGVIAGFCYGALYGLDTVSKCNYQKVEYHERLTDAGKKLFALAVSDSYLDLPSDVSDKEIPIDDLFA